MAVGTLPDGTPVVVSGGSEADGSVRVWRLADGSSVGEPLPGHDGEVSAVAVGFWQMGVRRWLAAVMTRWCRCGG